MNRKYRTINNIEYLDQHEQVRVNKHDIDNLKGRVAGLENTADGLITKYKLLELDFPSGDGPTVIDDFDKAKLLDFIIWSLENADSKKDAYIEVSISGKDY